MPGKSFQNRLIKEKSPYLLQHAYNPVDWYPWGDEAFNAAKEFDKPIFLSIGYATCHWCHVMSRESFDNPEIAALMNEVYINVKVDREELPEIDSLYMEFAQALMATGTGWPLNLILTPQLKPFYAITYLPPETRQEMMGMKELTHHIHQLWKSDERELLSDQAEKLVDLFARSVQTRGEQLPNESHLDTAIEMFFQAVDPVYGGLKGAPKFPLGYQTHFFLHYAEHYQDPRPLFYVELTLDMMRRGGIYDQVGGGFSRYSIDEKWVIPHFEKMLYDNALLAGAYLASWQVTKKPFYKNVTDEILNYILRDMQHPEGGFYSAEDAETDGKEGAYYIWTYQEIKTLLAAKDCDLFCDFFGITEKGNFEGSNVLHRTSTLDEFAKLRGLNSDAIEVKFESCLKILYEVRQKRPRPFKDDKILVSWNAMMIDTLARAGIAFNSTDYMQKAQEAALFIKKHLWKDGILLRRYRDGQTDFEGGLEDYAYMIRALITLFEADQGSAWLEWAIEMTTLLEEQFKAEEGAFYQTSSEHSILLRRPELYDAAQPSGNAIHAENLLRLEQLTHNREYRIQAEDILKVAASYIETYPMGACYHLIALQRYLDKDALTLVIALNEKEKLKEELKGFLSEAFFPNSSIIWKKTHDQNLIKLLPYLEEFPPIDNQTTLYVCQQGRCQAPLTDLEEMRAFFRQ